MLRRTLLWVVVTVAWVGLSSTARADPPPSGSSALSQSLWRHLELEFPLMKPLRFSFNADPVPGFEPLRLPTFRSESVWLEHGNLSLRSFSQVAQATELDCSLNCQPMLQRTLGVEGLLGLGAVNRSVPATYLYVRGQTTQAFPTLPGARATQKFGLLSAGLSGLLDF